MCNTPSSISTSLVLTMAPGEADDALGADVDDRSISKTGSASHRPIKLGGDIALPSLVVRHPGVEVPSFVTTVDVAIQAKECLSLGIIKVDLLLWRRLDGDVDLLHHGHEVSWIFFLGLGHVDPLLLRLAAIQPEVWITWYIVYFASKKI
jgi:hypothetical protein